ncbi:DUF262 domain-containing protein [Microbacterium sp. 1.5R]|uniref:DUF262 domain-containing protein n=1 Tax=Microbacterium sp. 1.5R TaxID=1916917 RepID=UPI0011A3D45A|nr:DUF262 domain-containing protein [Microbacterium sp. 1.5R]
MSLEAIPDEKARRNLTSRQREALVQAEFITSGLGDDEVVVRPTDDEINQKYERGEIRIVTESGRYPLDSVSKMVSADNYKMDPDYQRRRRWDVAQKSRLIESFIMNVPVPPIFLYEWDFNQYEVMDGLQRMTSVRDFYENEFALTGLEYWQELEGRHYRDLPSRIKAGIDRRYISSIILLKETSHGGEDPEQLKRFVFGRINTGGVKLTAQELRNALYEGPMNRLCKQLSSFPALRRLWDIPENVEELIISPESALRDDSMLDFDVEIIGAPDPVPELYRDMSDVELVLRFFANRQRMLHYRDNLRDYLDEYLKAANSYDEATLEGLKAVFSETMQLAYDIFGENAFRRRANGKWRTVPSVSIYDALTNVLSRLLPQADALRSNSEAIIEGLDGFYEENARKFNLRGQTRSDLMDREILFEQFLTRFV